MLNKPLGWREQRHKDLHPSYRKKHENNFFFKVNGVLGQPASVSELFLNECVILQKMGGGKADALSNVKQIWMATSILAYLFDIVIFYILKQKLLRRSINKCVENQVFSEEDYFKI